MVFILCKLIKELMGFFKGRGKKIERAKEYII
jgi:hypothetical protein